MFFTVHCSFCIAAPALKWGRVNESIARKAYEDCTGFAVTKTGLTLHQEFPYLGATSDGLVDDSVVIELKCPYSGRDKSVSDLIASGYQHIAKVDDKFILKCNSPYYCQVQGEMALKKVDLCHFVVWTPVNIEIIEVKFDSDFSHKHLLPKLITFYRTHVAPR